MATRPFSLLALLALVGCPASTPGSSSCVAGTTLDCKCSATEAGIQVCNASGKGYGACDCGGDPTDASDTTDAPDGGGPDTPADDSSSPDSGPPTDASDPPEDTPTTDPGDITPPPECSGDEDCPPATPTCTPQGVCVLCYPGTKFCEGDTSMVCLPDGTGAEVVEDCAASGTACNEVGVCQSACGGFAKLEGTNAGCEFWAVDLRNAQVSTPAKFLDAQNAPFVVVVANTDAEGQAGVTVTSPDGTVQSADIPAGSLATFGIGEAFGLKGSGRTNNGVHIVATKAVVAFQFNPYANEDVFSNDASMLYPAHLQGGEYRVVTLPHQNLGGDADFPGYVAIVGSGEGAVSVTVTVTAPTSGGDDIPALSVGGSHTFTVAPGEVVALESKSGDLSGTKVVAAGPVMVFAGHVAARTDECCSDHLEQQMPPLAAWGKEYAIAQSWERSNNPDHLRIVASEPTQVTIDAFGSPKIVALQAGQVHETIFEGHIAIKADKRVLVAQVLASAEDGTAVGPCNTPADCGGVAYKCEPFGAGAVDVCQMKSCATDAECGPGFSCAASLYGTPGKECKAVGDPAMMIAVPTSRWQDRFVFVTPDKYLFDYVNIVCEAGTTVTLDGETISSWEPLGGGFVVHRTPVSDGVHVIDSSAPCTVTVYGYDNHVSYGYPGGARLL